MQLGKTNVSSVPNNVGVPKQSSGAPEGIQDSEILIMGTEYVCSLVGNNG